MDFLKCSLGSFSTKERSCWSLIRHPGHFKEKVVLVVKWQKDQNPQAHVQLPWLQLCTSRERRPKRMWDQPKKRCSWLERALCTYSERVFGRFFTDVGKHLTQAVGRRSICSILLSMYLQIMLLSLGIITNSHGCLQRLKQKHRVT